MTLLYSSFRLKYVTILAKKVILEILWVVVVAPEVAVVVGLNGVVVGTY